jgi:hypothetical protein
MYIGDYMTAYGRRLRGEMGPEEMKKAAKAWSIWEGIYTFDLCVCIYIYMYVYENTYIYMHICFDLFLGIYV